MNIIEESRLVDNARRDVLLYRILSGKLDYKDSYIREPTLRTKEIGAKVYYQILKDCQDVLSERDIYVFLIHSKQWSVEQQKKLDGLPKEIENLKVSYYQNFRNPSIRKSSKIELDYKNHMYKELFVKRNKYKNLTAEGIATGAMWFEMIKHMYKGSDTLQAINFYHSNTISDDDIRSIALNDTWLSIFSSSKNVFGRGAIKLTGDQKRLLMWSNIYRNTRSAPESPPDDIYNDHDAFDGYLIADQRKNKAEKKIEQIEKGFNKNAQNVYMFIKNDEEFNEVNSLNTEKALRNIENEFKEKK